jgi:DNA-directed RNA polymerase subunit RPC12/RpoP
MQVIDFKCGNCGSSMIFDSGKTALACPSCGRTDSIEGLPDPVEALKPPGAAQPSQEEYHCASCGGLIEADGETTATLCSFCGASAILGDRLAGGLRPAQVLPFAIGKDEAVRAFKKWCRNGRLTPKGFMTADRIKSITGTYVPFWLYALNNHIEARAQATKVRTYVQGDYRITETQHFSVYRRIRLNYSRVPLDASEKMSDQLMDRLEPFPYHQIKDFKTPYLAGYKADKYSYTGEEMLPRVKEKIRPYVEAYIQSAMAGYTTVSYTQKDVDTRMAQADYVLIPVWVVHYDYDKLEHTFAMNGQTGKVVGKPPISYGKVAAWFAGVSGVTFLSLKLIALLMGGGLW